MANLIASRERQRAEDKGKGGVKPRERKIRSGGRRKEKEGIKDREHMINR